MKVLLISILLCMTLSGCLVTGPVTGITYDIEVVEVPIANGEN